MTALLLITGGILLIVTLGVVYRIVTLVSIAKGTSQKRVGLSNKINAILLPIVFIIGIIAMFWYSGIAQEYFLPEAASEHGKATDTLFWTTISVITVVFIFTNALLFFFSFRYQHKEGRDVKFYPENHKLEIIWTVVPAIVMTVLVIGGWRVWTDITSPAPEDAIEIELMAKQFNWQVRYPGKDKTLGQHNYRKIDGTNSMGVDFSDPKSMDDFIPREIHIPKGKNVKLRIRARDVLHSVFMPHFRVKMDAVPGMPTTFWFTPTISTTEMREKLGDPKFNYELACTEICGSGHFAMKMTIVVDEPADFDKWFNEQEPWAAKNADYIKELKEKGGMAMLNE